MQWKLFADLAEEAGQNRAAVDPEGEATVPDALEPPLSVRARRSGDQFHPLGAPGHRKLKDFLIDEGVPRHLRDRLPLVVDAAGRIAWVGGCRAAEPARVKGAGERVLHLRAVPAEPSPSAD